MRSAAMTFPHWDGIPASWSEPPFPIDLWESDDEFVLCALLPGCNASTCSVSADGDQLVIEGKPISVAVPSGARVLVQELNPGELQASDPIPGPDQCRAGTRCAAGWRADHPPAKAPARAAEAHQRQGGDTALMALLHVDDATLTRLWQAGRGVTTHGVQGLLPNARRFQERH